MTTGSAALPLGRVVATANAAKTIPGHEILAALTSHASGDWGAVCEEDWELNDWSLSNGERILSAYATAGGTRFWIITERDRSATTVLLPEDY